MTQNNPGDSSQPPGSPPPYRPAPGYPPQGPGRYGSGQTQGAGQNYRPGQNPSVPQGYGQPGYPQPPLLPQPKPGNGFGIAALVLGILAVLASFIPFVGVFSFILGPLAILFGILGLTLRRQSGKGTSITGMILGAASVVIAVAVTSFAAIFIGQVSENHGVAGPSPSQNAGTTPEIPSAGPEPGSGPSVDSVTGSKVELIATVSKGKASVTYSVGGDTADKDFTGEFKAQGTLDGTIGLATVVVLGDPLTEDQQLGCEIRVDGKTVKKETGKTVVSCTVTKAP